MAVCIRDAHVCVAILLHMCSHWCGVVCTFVLYYPVGTNCHCLLQSSDGVFVSWNRQSGAGSGTRGEHYAREEDRPSLPVLARPPERN